MGWQRLGGKCRLHLRPCSPGLPIPEPFRAMGSLAFAKLLIEGADVAVFPGIGFGEYGERGVGLALVENKQRLGRLLATSRGSSSVGASTRSPRPRSWRPHEFSEDRDRRARHGRCSDRGVVVENALTLAKGLAADRDRCCIRAGSAQGPRPRRSTVTAGTRTPGRWRPTPRSSLYAN